MKIHWSKMKTRWSKTKTYWPKTKTRGEGTPRKIGLGCAAHFPKSSPYLWPKYVIFHTLFISCPKFDFFFVIIAGGTVAININYEGLLLMVLSIMIKSLLLKNIPSSRWVQKPNPIYDQNGQNRCAIYDQSGFKNHTFAALLHCGVTFQLI